MPVEYALPTLFRSRTWSSAATRNRCRRRVLLESGGKRRGRGVRRRGSGRRRDRGRSARRRLETWNRREIKDCPDLLHLAKTRPAAHHAADPLPVGLPRADQFSNAAFYGNRLSVPARHPDGRGQSARADRADPRRRPLRGSDQLQQRPSSCRSVATIWTPRRHRRRRSASSPSTASRPI